MHRNWVAVLGGAAREPGVAGAVTRLMRERVSPDLANTYLVELWLEAEELTLTAEDSDEH